MKSSIKKVVATLAGGLSSVAVFAAGTSSETSSGVGAAGVIGFFVVLVGILLVPALGHKTHH
jgi:hypothetical protein